MLLLEWIAKNFEKTQIAILVFGGFIILTAIRNRNPKSQFRKREADRGDLDRILKQGPELGQAKMKKNAPPTPPLSLPGIRLSGEAHEILGVRADASEIEVIQAYKEAIKRFHPDRIQGIDPTQLQFYQEASATLNQAKESMIKKIRDRP